MTIKKTLLAIAIVTTGMMTGCATEGQKPVASGADSDLVAMPGMGGSASGAGMAGMTAMTRDEVYQCAKMIADLERQNVQLKGNNRELEDGRRKLDNLARSLDQERPTIDTRNTKQVNDFNRRIQEHRDSVVAQNERVKAYNVDVGIVNALNNQFKTGCAGRAYRQSDLALVPAEIRLAVGRHSVTSTIPLIGEPGSEKGSGGIHLGK